MKKFITNNFTLYTFGIVILFLGWTIISLSIPSSNFIFPDPISTFKEMFVLLSRSYVYKCLFYSTLKMLIGFLIAFVLALIFGTIAGSIKYTDKILTPIIILIKTIPTAALVYLFLVILKSAEYTPVAIVAIISFPILFEAISGGIKNIDKDILDALKLEEVSWIKKLIHVRIPLALPYVLVGVFSSFALRNRIRCDFPVPLLPLTMIKRCWLSGL